MHTHIYNKELIVKPATCGTAGTKRMDCACGAHGTTSVIPATGRHSFGTYVTTVQPTALATGTKVRTCKTCGSKETAAISKLKAFVKLNFSGTLPLKVKQSTTAVKVTMAKGDKIVSWKTSNKKIATVSGSGKITGKKAGNAKITVKLRSGISKTFKVKVTKAAVATKSIKLNMKKVTLAKGKSVKLVASLLPITTRDKVRFTTSNSKVATVSSKGVIKAKKKGKATITVYAGKKKAIFKVTVR
jgi:Bacterial surface proteins containing Ig-like domains